ncbi:hypothetical protein ACI2JA_20020 [Alkalihalobacillus sp. NPDC078783]
MSYRNLLLHECRSLSRFKSLDAFNESFMYAMKEYKDQFSKSELVAIKEIKNRGVAAYGVVGAKLGTIIKDAAHRLGFICPSRRTFERAITKAKKLGILKVVNRKQKDQAGKEKNILGHSIYVFELFSSDTQMAEREPEKLAERENAEDPCPTSHSDEKEESDTSEFNARSLKSLKIRTLDASFTPSYVPVEFKEHVQRYFDNAELIKNLWLRVKMDKKKESKRQAQVEKNGGTLADYYALEVLAAKEAFKQTIYAKKKNRIQSNLYKYFYGTFHNVLAKEINVHYPNTDNPFLKAMDVILNMKDAAVKPKQQVTALFSHEEETTLDDFEAINAEFN